jgi:hypothetical protein
MKTKVQAREEANAYVTDVALMKGLLKNLGGGETNSDVSFIKMMKTYMSGSYDEPLFLEMAERICGIYAVSPFDRAAAKDMIGSVRVAVSTVKSGHDIINTLAEHSANPGFKLARKLVLGGPKKAALIKTIGFALIHHYESKSPLALSDLKPESPT